MKNNKGGLDNFLKIGIFIVAVAIVVLFVDKGLNGVFKTWIYELFYFDEIYAKSGKVGIIYRSWNDVKIFIIATFTIIATLLTISFYLYGRNVRRREISYISNVINSFMSDENTGLVLDKKYSEIENELIKIKANLERQEQLGKKEVERKNNLITYLAHDLKTPLASIIGYLSLMDEASDMPMEQKIKYTKIALDKANRLELLINEFFDITRFNLQTIVLDKGKVKLYLMLQQLSDEVYPTLKSQNKSVLIEADEGIEILGDRDKLARVFNNILKNAIIYSYENSVIYIKVKTNEEKVNIAFKNTGKTIPPIYIETIFEKFYRLDTSRSTNTGGAGLGLAIAKEIVMAHNGEIIVKSENEETTFEVELPY